MDLQVVPGFLENIWKIALKTIVIFYRTLFIFQEVQAFRIAVEVWKKR